MNNTVWQNVLYKIINIIESYQQSQSDCDNCYKELCDVITNCHPQYFTSNSKNIRKKLKVTKPYWNEELTNM